MRFLIVLLFFPLVLAQQPVTFKVQADYIKVPVTVFDPHGRIITDLTRDNFRLLDEGEPRPIENFVLDKAPVHVLLLLDVSGSIREELEQFGDAAYQFAGSFGKEDRISVISFADEVLVLQDWTNDLKRIRKSLKALKRGFRTAFYDALMTITRNHFDGVGGKKVIIVLTDGLDNESLSSSRSVAERLVESTVSLYIVSRTRLLRQQVEKSERVEFLNDVMKRVLHEPKDFVEVYFREKETALVMLAEATGGRVLFPEKLEDLKGSYVQVAEELKSQYILTFHPLSLSEKKFRTIQVECTEPVGRLNHRKQYMVH